MNERPLLQQTYLNFKLDFTATHQNLPNTDATVDELGYSRASTIVAYIVDQLRAELPAEMEQIVPATTSSLFNNLPKLKVD